MRTSKSDLAARLVGAKPYAAWSCSSVNSRSAPTVVVLAAPGRPSIEVIQSVDASVIFGHGSLVRQQSPPACPMADIISAADCRGFSAAGAHHAALVLFSP